MTEYGIRAGEYSAVVTARGAALRQLRRGERDLIVPFPAGGPIPDYRGIIAVPWPNRIADGRYTFDGEDYEVPINESERDCALHGLAFGKDWVMNSHHESSVELSCTVEPTPGYPFRLRITAEHRLSANGLQSRVTATNVGKRAAPYGVCPHPYLLAGPAPLDEWTLEIPAKAFLEVTTGRLLPIAVRSVEGHDYDFRTAKSIGATEIDHAFTDIAFDSNGRAEVILSDPGGTRVGMTWDQRCTWLQIHTADKKAPSVTRLGLAVEPMTCPPDAFNSGLDLVKLQPGESHDASWTIFGS